MPSGASARGSHRLAEAGGGCEVRFGYTHGLQISQKYEPPWRMIGTLVHNCLAYYYGEKCERKPAFLAEQTLEECLRGCTNDDALIRNALAVTESYKQFWHAEPWKPVFVEEEFTATVGEIDPGGPDRSLDGEVVTCRSDLVIEVNGEHWIVDHKCSAGMWGQDHLETWKDDGEYKMSWQAMVNLMVHRAISPAPIRGFIINRIKRKPPYDFDRHALAIPVTAYQRAPRSIREFVRRDVEIVRKFNEGGIDALTSNFSQCHGRWGACSYLPLCSAETESMRQTITEIDYVKHKTEKVLGNEAVGT